MDRDNLEFHQIYYGKYNHTILSCPTHTLQKEKKCKL